MKITAVSGSFSITGSFPSGCISESVTEEAGHYPAEFSMTFGPLVTTLPGE